MTVYILLDENMPRRAILRELAQYDVPLEQVQAVGHGEAPPLATPDPDILDWIEANDYLLMTRNRASMPGHLRDHLAAGKHVPGIIIVPHEIAPWDAAELIYFILEVSLPNEFYDRIVYSKDL